MTGNHHKEIHEEDGRPKGREMNQDRNGKIHEGKMAGGWRIPFPRIPDFTCQVAKWNIISVKKKNGIIEGNYNFLFANQTVLIIKRE